MSISKLKKTRKKTRLYIFITHWYKNTVGQINTNTNTAKPKTTYKLFLIVATSTAILLVSPVLILLGLGYFIDKIFHTAPYALSIGGVIGFISGIFNVFRMTKLMQNRKKNTI
jgi:F0F1-type ATP synthase assembly protein I